MLTLAEVQKLNPSAISKFVLSELMYNNMLGLLPFVDVAESGNGGTTVYIHNRIKKGSGVSTRAIGGKYALSTAELEQITVRLGILGGKFEIDRRITLNIRPEREAMEISEKIASARALFNFLTIHGDQGVNANGFDGLSKALLGATKQEDTNVHDWSAGIFETRDAFKLLASLDDLNSTLNGAPGMYLGSQKIMNKIRQAARLTNAYTTQVTPLSDRTEFYGSIALIDVGQYVTEAQETKEVMEIDPVTGQGELYAVRLSTTNGFHGVTSLAGDIVEVKRPNYDQAEEQVNGLVEIGPVGVALQSLKGAAVLRNIQVQAAA